MKKDDVLFLCQYFYPEYISSAKLPFDIAEAFAEHGYTVGALCGYPKEYSHEHHCPSKETVNNVKIKRIHYSHFKRRNFIGRALNIFSFTFFSLMHVGTLKKYRCVCVISDPPVLPIVTVFAKKLFRTKIVFISYDVFPEISEVMGTTKKHGPFHKIMSKINLLLHKNVSHVVVLTEEMKQFLLNNRCDSHLTKISVIPNWATDVFTKKLEPASYKRFGYKNNQFIVSYFGNMGVCQDMDTLLAAAKTLKNDTDIKIMLAGHGTKIHQIKKAIKENHLYNVQLMDFLDGDDYDRALSISSCCIVSLEKGLKGTCAPSKYYSYLQAGCPVISVGEKDSYLALEVQKQHIGFAVEAGDHEGLVKYIRHMNRHRDSTRQRAKNARKLYLKKYDKPIGLQKYCRVLDSVLQTPAASAE